MRVDAVVKLGGSLLETEWLRPLLDSLCELARDGGLVVVPGGGALATAVRRVTARHAPGQSASHWMAILAMEQHAHLLAGLAREARLVTQAEEVEAATAAGRLAVLAPFAWLRAADPLPHGWHVTSDSIAAWIAARLGARRLVLVKAVDDPDTLPRSELVDAYFETALEPGIECRIVSGRQPERLTAALREGLPKASR